MDKQSSLSDPFVSFEENKVWSYFLCNLQMGPATLKDLPRTNSLAYLTHS
jgi:hypothetical protein